MQQVLFWIPIHTPMTPNGIPVYGFGLMLFLVFIISSWLAGRRAEREGLPKDKIGDLVLWIFIGGLVGARITFMIQYRDRFQNPLVEFFQIWKGGIVFYGSAIGGWLSYLLAKKLLLSNFPVSGFQLADIFAPSVAIGLALGRIGCLLNGCCYGHVAAPDAPAIHFPLQTAPARDLVWRYQTAAGFSVEPPAIDRCQVKAVESGSAAQAAGLLPGDMIVGIDGQAVRSMADLDEAMSFNWPQGKVDIALKVMRNGQELELPAFTPRTIGLYPTQIYETVSAFLIFLLLISLYPFRQYDGQVFVVLMICYAIHRYLNEMLRNDTAPVAFGLTLSQNISILIFSAGVLLGLWRRRYPRRSASQPMPGAEHQKA